VVLGIVCGYWNQDDKVMDGENKTEMFFHANSGLLVARPIKVAIDLIEANPVGALISDP
jgi:hypothetical protein